jgi:hypothetical protein
LDSDYFFFNRMDFILFLEQIWTHCIPYGIRGEEKHSTTPEGPPQKGNYSLNLLFIYFYLFFEPQQKWIQSYFNYPFLLSSSCKASSHEYTPQKPDRPHTRASVSLRTTISEVCSPTLSVLVKGGTVMGCTQHVWECRVFSCTVVVTRAAFPRPLIDVINRHQWRLLIVVINDSNGRHQWRLLI